MPSNDASYLLCLSNGRRCAVPTEHVIETFRPLRVERLEGAPSFVRGLAMIRGVPTPVVDLGLLLNGRPVTDPGRFVTVRAGNRTAALAVDEVTGIRDLPRSSISALPPLVSQGPEPLVSALATLDRDLLFVLEAARIIPDDVWNAMEESAR